jgi:hypothetical protein
LGDESIQIYLLHGEIETRQSKIASSKTQTGISNILHNGINPFSFPGIDIVSDCQQSSMVPGMFQSKVLEVSPPPSPSGPDPPPPAGRSDLKDLARESSELPFAGGGHAMCRTMNSAGALNTPRQTRCSDHAMCSTRNASRRPCDVCYPACSGRVHLMRSRAPCNQHQ